MDRFEVKVNWISFYLSDQNKLACMMNGDMYLIWEVLQ